MLRLPGMLCFTFLLLLAGCSRAELSEYRQGYLLAQPHGWIELSVAVPRTSLTETDRDKGCSLGVIVNGEAYLYEPLPFLRDGQEEIRSGFLFPVAAGKNELQLTLTCAKDSSLPLLQVEVPEGQLLPASLDGRSVSAGEPRAYDEASIQQLAKRLDALENAGNAAAGRQQEQWQVVLLVVLGVGGVLLVLSLALLGVLLWRTRRRSA